MGIMLLLEEGKIKIEDEVEKYIPEWKDLSVYQSGSIEKLITVPPKRKMIILDLLTHRSGLTYHFNESTIAQLYLEKGVTIARSPEKLTPDDKTDSYFIVMENITTFGKSKPKLSVNVKNSSLFLKVDINFFFCFSAI